MMTPRITIGMAVCNDFAGAWATVQSACWHNEWENPNDVEIIIVDNASIRGDNFQSLANGDSGSLLLLFQTIEQQLEGRSSAHTPVGTQEVKVKERSRWRNFVLNPSWISHQD